MSKFEAEESEKGVNRQNFPQLTFQKHFSKLLKTFRTYDTNIK